MSAGNSRARFLLLGSLHYFCRERALVSGAARRAVAQQREPNGSPATAKVNELDPVQPVVVVVAANALIRSLAHSLTRNGRSGG